MSEERIILTDKEKELIEKQLNGQFSPFDATNEERQTLSNVIQSAEILCKELDAYDDIGDGLLQWYYNKYKAQQ